MASGNSFFDELRNKPEIIDPPQNEDMLDIAEHVNDTTQTVVKPNTTVTSSVRELLECPVCLNAMSAMGQAQSSETVEDQSSSKTSNSTEAENATPQPSLDSLIAEAAAYGNEDDNASLEEKAQKALDCPCIAHLRSGPCGSQFSNAFVCFLKSTAEEKGSDCVQPFIALQKCIKVNPNAFSADILEDDENDAEKEEKPSPQNKIRPSIWSEKPTIPNN